MRLKSNEVLAKYHTPLLDKLNDERPDELHRDYMLRTGRPVPLRKKRRCKNCGKEGHYAKTCPELRT